MTDQTADNSPLVSQKELEEQWNENIEQVCPDCGEMHSREPDSVLDVEQTCCPDSGLVLGYRGGLMYVVCRACRRLLFRLVVAETRPSSTGVKH